jgi:16S rRNA (guanine527-N7)-methyltransferase
MNFVQEKTIENILQRHILDSLQISEHIDYQNDIVFDIGSGAGFPGMVLAIGGVQKINLVEPTGKKVIFLDHIKNLYNLKIAIHQSTWQQLKLHNATMVVSRAYTKLSNLLEVFVFVSRETIAAKGIFLKGEKLDNEICEAQQKWTFSYETYPSVTHEKGRIIKVWNVIRK